MDTMLFLDKYSLNMDQHFFFQIGIVIISILISFILSNFLNKQIANEIISLFKKKTNKTSNFFLDNLYYLSTPIYLAIILTFGFIITAASGYHTEIILLLTQFSIIWFILRFITVLSGSHSPRPIVIILGIIIFLDVFDLTETTVKTLEKLAVNIGGFHISTYLLLKVTAYFIILLWVINTISRIIKRTIYRLTHLNISAKHLSVKVLDALLYFILFLFILNLIGVDITTLAVVGSAIGIGIGFGLQKITSNFISGVILLFEKSIKEGDVIELSNNQNEMGYVRHLGIRYTLIETFDKKEIMVPNEDFITNKVTNWTYSDNEIRVKIDIGVSYSSDLDLVMKLIMEAANKLQKESVQKKPKCFLHEYGDSSVNFILYIWVDNVADVQHRTRSQVLLEVWKKFEEHNITIPFPQRDLHIKSNDTIEANTELEKK